ncbi:hypothetical protein ASG29_04950 [Sphingomonas sp. Leaf412]|uniref:GAF domain-containing protein n=1 Tax=Sphingomonas sp. Leaf412 TaxID=1736370 RepID=UPI0006F716B0|nr:GAF domain-containing protein [Sphingomonas sp. Leaf412]KQT33407.1 hypothetical protein ASG29_04950 [Sphingomonas sp. Leaf412]
MSISFYEMPPTIADEAERCRAVARSGALEATGDPVLCSITVEAKDRMRASTSLVSIVQGDYQHLVAATGVEMGIYSRRMSFCGHALASGQPAFCVPDLSQDRRFAGNPYVSGELATHRFYAAAILYDRRGMALGVLCVLDDRPRDPPSPQEAAMLRDLADAVVARLEQLRSGDD